MHVYDVGEQEGRCYLVMELLSGGTLRDYLHEQISVSREPQVTQPESSATETVQMPPVGGLPFEESRGGCRQPVRYDVGALRGWCNWQHCGFWFRLWGFESSPPSSFDSHSAPAPFV